MPRVQRRSLLPLLLVPVLVTACGDDTTPLAITDVPAIPDGAAQALIQQGAGPEEGYATERFGTDEALTIIARAGTTASPVDANLLVSLDVAGPTDGKAYVSAALIGRAEYGPPIHRATTKLCHDTSSPPSPA